MPIEEVPQTLLDAVRYFADLEICNDYMRELKWPNGVVVALRLREAKGRADRNA